MAPLRWRGARPLPEAPTGRAPQRALRAVGRQLRRSVLRTDFPALLAPGSRGVTRCARYARSAQTDAASRKRSALRAPTPTLRCSAPQKPPHRAKRPLRRAPRWRLRQGTRPTPPQRRHAALAPAPLSPAARATSTACDDAGGTRLATRAPTQSRAGFVTPTSTSLAKARVVHRGRACAQPRSAAAPARARSARRPHFRGVCPSGASEARAASYAAPAGAASIAGNPPRSGGLRTQAPAVDDPCLCARRRMPTRADAH